MAKYFKRLELFDSRGMSDSLRQSLYMVIWGVTICMITNVVTTGASWTGFQREVLKADDLQLGLIAAIPVAANLLQIFISFYMERKRNRRFLFLFFGLIGRAMWIVIGLVPFFIPVELGTLRVAAVVALVCVISMGNSFMNLSFASLMGDLIPMRIRGAYLGTRQKISLISGIVAGLAVSAIVDRMGALGYSIVLIVAGVAGCLDVCCFFGVDWPPMAARKAGEREEKPLLVIGEVLKNRNFMRFTLAFTLWALALNIPAPFFNVFMLEEMRMSYTAITLTNQIVSNLMTVLVVARWGKLLDRFGNKPVLQLTCLVVACVPLLWVFMSPSTVWLVMVSNTLSGLFYCVLDVSIINLYLSLSPQKNRSIYVAVFFVAYNLLGVALGNALGGWLMQDVFSAVEASGLTLLGMRMTKYRCLYITSSVLRLLVVLLAFPLMREPGSTGLKEMSGALRAERAAHRGLTRPRRRG